jgi:ATP-dependent protease HslVU (ClpYQ) peptidase subunit
MTVIAAISDGKKVYMGGDSALSTGDHVFLSADPKVFERDGIVVGFCGSILFGELVALTKFPAKGKDVDLWVRGDVCEALRMAAIRRGRDISDGDDSEAILGIGGQIYVITSGPVAYRVRGSYAAIGSGGPWAEGSLYSTDGGGMSIKERIVTALEAAEIHCSAVRSPWAFAGL